MSHLHFIWMAFVFSRVMIGAARWTKIQVVVSNGRNPPDGSKMPGGQAFCILHFSICPQHEEAVVTLAMLHIDRARTRMPLVCTVISMLVLTVFGALGFISWLLEANNMPPDLQGAKSAHVPQYNTPATDVPDASDPYETESWVRHGREF